MMNGNALKRSFVGRAALAVELACTIMNSDGESDAILQKVSKLVRVERIVKGTDTVKRVGPPINI